MDGRVNGYTGYSIGCFAVWAGILAAASASGDTTKRNKLACAFGGWTAGWLSATIARAVYAPPRSRLRRRPPRACGRRGRNGPLVRGR